MVRQDVATSEGVSLKGKCETTKDEIDALMDTGLLQAGALPAFQVEEESGQAELLGNLTNDSISARRKKREAKMLLENSALAPPRRKRKPKQAMS